MRVYAVAEDFYTFTGETNPGTADPVLDALLARASIMIDAYTRTSIYEVDNNGYPVAPLIQDAFKYATCAQAAWFQNTEDITGGDSQSGLVKIGSVQLGGGSSNANSFLTADQARVAPEALTILRNAGLLAPTIAHT